MTSRQGTGKPQTFFYSSKKYKRAKVQKGLTVSLEKVQLWYAINRLALKNRFISMWTNIWLGQRGVFTKIRHYWTNKFILQSQKSKGHSWFMNFLWAPLIFLWMYIFRLLQTSFGFIILAAYINRSLLSKGGVYLNNDECKAASKLSLINSEWHIISQW